MRRSGVEEQGVGPEEEKDKKQTEYEQKEERSGRSRTIRQQGYICPGLLVL